MVSPRKRDSSGKKASKLYVEPAELARKLIKELEGTKMSRGGRSWVRDQYTVFLCREDFARLRSHLDELVRKLESHMERHVQGKRYATAGAITVELTMDPDLKPGYFGVLAERADQYQAEPGAGSRPSQGKSVWDVPEDLDRADVYEEDQVPGRSGLYGGEAGQGYGFPDVPPPPVQPPAVPGMPPAFAEQQPLQQTPPQVSQQAPVVPPMTAPPMSVPPVPAPPMPTPAVAVPTRAVPSASAPAAATPFAPRDQGPAAAEALVLKVNGQERVFPTGKAVVGRSRDVDVQIDSADVSRRHAMIYCSEGGVLVKDLGSTNGTMVNGYPVDTTVVRPSDVIRIGNAHITAASK